jgi:hypothetical protein
VEQELGIRIDAEEASLRSAEVCRDLRLSCEKERVTPLITGEFPLSVAGAGEHEEVRRLSPEQSPSKGGVEAARHAPSAAAIAKLLGGIDFPKHRAGIVAYARKHGDRVHDPELALAVLSHLPDRELENMADVTRALGELPESMFPRKSSIVPERAPSAADVEKAIAGIDFPKNKAELVAYASQRLPEASPVRGLLDVLPERVYRDAAEVAIAFGETKAPHHRAHGEREAPSRRGGRASASGAVSAAAIAKMLGGIQFPTWETELLAHAEHAHAKVQNRARVLEVISHLPHRQYRSMADVEVEVGKIL